MTNTNDIESFVEKATIIEKTIRGIASGEVDPNHLSLKEYGILTPEEEEEEKIRKERQAEERRRKEDEKKKKLKESECQKWWEGAVFLYGEREESASMDLSIDGKKEHRETQIVSNGDYRKLLSTRYSSDYSRWSEEQYVPDDEATKEEEKEQKLRKEEEENKIFEENNQEWCNSFKEDIVKRENLKKEKESSAEQLRLKGNIFFKKKKFNDALKFYTQAAEKDPYNTNILSNIAVVHSKTGCWDDTIEYCNRVIHIDKSYLKSYFHRYKANLALGKKERAFADLCRCIELSPNDEDLSRYRDELQHQLDSEVLENSLSVIMQIECKDFRESATGHSVESDDLSFEELCYVVTTSKDDEKYPSLVKKQTTIIDRLFRRIEKCGYREVKFDSKSNVLHQNMIQIFTEKKLHSCRIACLYMRTSGYLDKLLSYFTERCNHILAANPQLNEAKNDDDENEQMLIDAMDMVTEIMKHDQISINNLVESGSLATILTLLSDTTSNIEVMISASNLIAGCFSHEGKVADKVSRTILKKDSFLRSICNNIRSWSSSLSSNTMSVKKVLQSLQAITLSGQIVAGITSNERLRNKFFEINQLITDESTTESITESESAKVVQNVCLALHIPRLRNDDDIAKSVIMMRKSLTRVMLVMSTIGLFRCSFQTTKAISYQNTKVVSVSPIGILFALAFSYKSEPEVTRKMALMTLSNLIVEKDSHALLDEMEQMNTKLDRLINLCISQSSKTSDTTPVIQQVASTLLDRLLSSSEILRSKCQVDDIQKLWDEFLVVVSDDKIWRNIPTAQDPSDNNAKYYATWAVNVIRIIASNVDKLGFIKKNRLNSNYAKVLINLFPKPQTNHQGKVTSETVCLPPQRPINGTAWSMACNTLSFHCNILKLIIALLDINEQYHEIFIHENGIEYLVSIISNSSSKYYHPLTIKNAASALARLFRCGDATVQQKCRDLRGMEILLELGREKRI